VEAPLYQEGFSLAPWQQGFVAEVLRHYRVLGQVRLLLADEVGLGKTLSMGTAAIVLCLLAEQVNSRRQRRPIVIFAPATLCEQWQTEMIDKLGVPCGRWDSLTKVWRGPGGRELSPRGAEHIRRCPMRIGIVSTGLVVQQSREKQCLSQMSFEVLVLDEAHKARTKITIGGRDEGPNELLKFMRDAASRSRHVLLGTATPIQTRPEDLWDLVRILHRGAGFVLGEEFQAWHDPERARPILTGEERVRDPDEAWGLLRSPLPPVELVAEDEHETRRLIYAIRSELGLLHGGSQATQSLVDLDPETREELENALEVERDGASFFQRHNPIVRHTVLRKRTALEERHLLPKIAVNVHPEPKLSRARQGFGALFEGHALRTGDAFEAAYASAERFGELVGQRSRSAGFMKNLMRQRVSSSIASGIATARRMLTARSIHDESDEEGEFDVAIKTDEEKAQLQALVDQLERMPKDPKFEAVRHYLEHEGWRQQGCIIFSQYYDTAEWLAGKLAELYPAELIGLYAGAAKSRLFSQGEAVREEREQLKRLVAERNIRIMVATDAACEGLNLQTLGTLINVDLPWNPTRLEQRIGRIKRFGQALPTVGMLNLVYQNTVDETVYERLSERMRDRYDIFGALPDTIRDEWIENIERLGEEMDRYIEARRQATGFDIRYNATIEPKGSDWRDCARVLARRDLDEIMRQSW